MHGLVAQMFGYDAVPSVAVPAARFRRSCLTRSLWSPPWSSERFSSPSSSRSSPVPSSVAALFAASATHARRHRPAAPSADLELELRHLAEEQRRFGETLLHRLHEASASHLDHERRRATTELDGKKALIDQQLGAMTGELGKVGELVRSLEARPPQGVRRARATSCSASTKGSTR